MTITPNSIPFFISCSTETTEGNKTGSWRFVRPAYDEKTAPCRAACPAGEDIARIENLIGQQKFREAYETILMDNPFPAVCGRVCFHPCERACNRSFFDQPMAIHAMERFIGDKAIAASFPVVVLNSSIPKKIAIAGAGPAGLSAAYFLARLGYECEVFEADSEPGGLLRWGIPAYRLPESVLQAEISRMERLGVRIFCQKPINQNFMKEASGRYDAVFLACGHGKPIVSGIAGEELAKDGLKFLRTIRKGKSGQLSGTVAIIGGGNTAVDVARSALRLGAKAIIAYRRRKEDMPAFEHELNMALQEGVELMELLAPIRIEKQDNYLALTLQRMKPLLSDSPSDIGSRIRVAPEEGKTKTIRVQDVFIAIGAEPEAEWQIFPLQKRIGENSFIKLSHCTLTQTDIPIIFGGDLTNNVKSVTDAIASGKQAAIVLDTLFHKGSVWIEPMLSACRIGNGPSLSMERYLTERQKTADSEQKPENGKQDLSYVVGYHELNTDYFFPKSRISLPSLSSKQAIESFSEIEQTLTEDSALEESRRCFNCGVCNDCDNCRLFCPEMAVIIPDERTPQYRIGVWRRINLDYCKGCGICVTECPRNAMKFESA